MNNVFAPSGRNNGVEGIYSSGFQNVAVDHTNGESALTLSLPRGLPLTSKIIWH